MKRNWFARVGLCSTVLVANALVVLAGYMSGTPVGIARDAIPSRSTPQCGVHCGTERWSVKTLGDADVGGVNFTPEVKTVDWLITQLRPDTLPTDNRNPLEKQAFRVTGGLVGYKIESDRDYHVVIADLDHPNETMIVEIPSPDCSGACSSGHSADFIKARQLIVSLAGSYVAGSSGLKEPSQPVAVEVVGVAFFDITHGTPQIGVAPNGVELHPVLEITQANVNVQPTASNINRNRRRPRSHRRRRSRTGP